MDAEFWREKWREERQGWRQAAPNPLLVRNLDALDLAKGARILVPLCGDSVDVGWLLSRGHRVVGVELVASAVERLFASAGVAPELSDIGSLRKFAGEGLEVFVGDLFDLDAGTLGPVEAVYDRAALVALPPETRRAYAAHLVAITACAPQLAITFDYEQSAMAGPPFAVPEREVRALYGGVYAVTPLESVAVDGGLKGFCPALEQAWRLTPAA
ncbi:thiopurine S-methyltransferase [Chenggangzhangella methanolivorans]|uniref:Thiopurine S-methyltransferase n=1 Tax=Chenggangzhangella methanolivorans TaxID=1437009 RepID=A0A9E6RFI5_9HYPH|nr:thiopurine S-methyltransferase [Chenggangzhangella methanolivorans]QZO00022.1 thiopurine S-methyltransferase [Chenggangzhangella methanolivorans]